MIILFQYSCGYSSSLITSYTWERSPLYRWGDSQNHGQIPSTTKPWVLKRSIKQERVKTLASILGGGQMHIKYTIICSMYGEKSKLQDVHKLQRQNITSSTLAKVWKPHNTQIQSTINGSDPHFVKSSLISELESRDF